MKNKCSSYSLIAEREQIKQEEVAIARWRMQAEHNVQVTHASQMEPIKVLNKFQELMHIDCAYIIVHIIILMSL
jgi:hypothetical protein